MGETSYAKDEESRNMIMDVLVMLLNDQTNANYRYKKIDNTRDKTA